MSDHTPPDVERTTLIKRLLAFVKTGTFLLLAGGFVAGVIFWGGFNTVLEMTNQEQFCISCHEMRDNVYVEYRNTIRDLMGIDFNSEVEFPPDDSGNGFDNNGEVLTVSPVLLERYMTAARRIARQAVGEPGTKPYYETYAIDKSLRQEGRMGDGLPFGTRGGEAVRHFFPLDANYSVRIRMARNNPSRWRSRHDW